MRLEKALQGGESNQTSNYHLFWHVTFSLCLVLTVAYGLHLMEQLLIKAEPALDNLGIRIAQASESPNKAELVEQSHSHVNIKPTEGFTFTLKYKNLGTTTWTKAKVYLKSTPSALKFSHTYWPDPYLPAQLSEKEVKPGEIGTFKFALLAPPSFNEYDGEFLLVNDNVMIMGGDAKVAMNVVPDPSAIKKPDPVLVEAPPNNDLNPIINKKAVCTLKLKPELQIASFEELDNVTCAEQLTLPENGPDVTVGLFHTLEPLTITNSDAWQVYDQNDNLLASVPANTALTFYYIKSKNQYAFDFIDHTVYTNSYLKLINFNKGIFEASNHEDRPSWNSSINYNLYSGDLEIKYNQNKERVWLIERLPLEEYVKGIKETSNIDPMEYQKTMIVAARTYALYHINAIAGEESFFDLYSDENDQVYKGYASAQAMPNVVAAAEATRGIIASYDDEVIIAYYSAISGGKTVSFKNIPYLKSVATPYTANLEKWGHGIGIDAYNARAQAREEGLTYDKILKYYYNGISLEKIY